MLVWRLLQFGTSLRLFYDKTVKGLVLKRFMGIETHATPRLEKLTASYHS